MIDQASELRKLVLRSVRQQIAASGPAPRLIVVTSGKTSVGVTSTAVNLSIALSESGLRVVIVDADYQHSDVAKQCGLNLDANASDVVVARRDIHEVLQRGPAGIQVVPALFSSESSKPTGDAAQDRILRQFKTLGRHADVIVLDGGKSTDFLRRCCRVADDVLLVTTPDSQSVLDSYAFVKSSLHRETAARIRLVVNRTSSREEGEQVFQSIYQSSQRFLRKQIEYLIAIPEDSAAEVALSSHRPVLVAAPDSPAAVAIAEMAERMMSVKEPSEAA